MKKNLLLLTFCFSFCYLHAQDIIVLRNGTTFKAKIVKVEGGDILYSDWNDPEAKTKMITTYDVYSIQYENGSTMVFDKQNVSSPSQSQNQSQQTSYTQASYEEPSSSKKKEKKSGMGSFHITGMHETGSDHSSLLTLDIGFDFGRVIGETPVFYTIGLSYLIRSGYDWAFDQTEHLQIPLKMGYLIGSTKSWYLTLQGGVEFNYLMSMRMKKERVDLSNSDRTSWNGVVDITLGHKSCGLTANYMFPFNSGGDGIWLIGFRFR